MDLHRLERENEELRKRQTLLQWGVASWVLATIIFCAWTTPLGLRDSGDPRFGIANVLAAALVGGTAYLVLFSWAFFYDSMPLSMRKLVLVSATIPAVCLVWGLALYNKHIQFDRGLRAFAAYTAHFPRSALGPPFIVDDESSVVTTCARQLRTSDTNFCVETVTQPKYEHSGEYVITGSFRYRDGDQDPDAPQGVILNAFDCSGAPVACAGN